VRVDAPNPNRDQNGFLDKAMGMRQIELYAESIQSKHALFLLDSCFSGSLFALSRAVPESISYKTTRHKRPRCPPSRSSLIPVGLLRP